MIKRIVEEINGLLLHGFPYSALGIALTLPDICGNIAYPNTNVGPHYKKWYDNYVAPKKIITSEDGHIAIDGEICYKLRCAYLHSGNFNLGSSDGVNRIESFTIQYNRDPNLRFIRIANSTNGKYQMDIDLGVLCWTLCEAATEFYNSHQSECHNATIEIKDVTPSEEEQYALRRLIE